MLSPSQNREKVEIFFLLMLLLFGLPMILLIPPGAGYDEEDHLVRVWELSAFSLIPGQLSAQELKFRLCSGTLPIDSKPIGPHRSAFLGNVRTHHSMRMALSAGN